MFLFASAITYKLIDIQFVKGDFYRKKAEERTVRNFEIKANRGNVYTADGSLLATSVSKFDIRMDAVTVSNENFEKNIKGLSKALSNMLGKSEGFYENYIRKARKNKNRYILITCSSSCFIVCELPYLYCVFWIISSYFYGKCRWILG